MQIRNNKPKINTDNVNIDHAYLKRQIKLTSETETMSIYRPKDILITEK